MVSSQLLNQHRFRAENPQEAEQWVGAVLEARAAARLHLRPRFIRYLAPLPSAAPEDSRGGDTEQLPQPLQMQASRSMSTEDNSGMWLYCAMIQNLVQSRVDIVSSEIWEDVVNTCLYRIDNNNHKRRQDQYAIWIISPLINVVPPLLWLFCFSIWVSILLVVACVSIIRSIATYASWYERYHVHVCFVSLLVTILYQCQTFFPRLLFSWLPLQLLRLAELWLSSSTHHHSTQKPHAWLHSPWHIET